MTRVDALDGVRAIAVTAVIASHVGIDALRGGGSGVLVFFVLSGYLITTLLLRERKSTGEISLRMFYARRALRLFPALAVVIAATVVAVQVTGAGFAPLSAVLAATFYYSNWLWFAQGTDPEVLGYLGHFWSLSVEEQFYLVWPLVLVAFARLRGRSLAIGLTAACVVVLAMRLVFVRDVADGHLLFGTHMIADQLLIGALLAVLLTVVPQRVAAVTRVLVWPSVLTLALTVALFHSEAPGVRGLLGVTVAPTIIAITSAILVGHLVSDQRATLTTALAWTPLVFLGRISYGMYLWHILAIVVASKIAGEGTLPAGLAAYVLTVLLASMSFFWWEKPFLRLKDRMQPRRVEPAER